MTNHAACSAAANQFEFYKYLEYQRFERFVSDGRSRPAVDRCTRGRAGGEGCTHSLAGEVNTKEERENYITIDDDVHDAFNNSDLINTVNIEDIGPEDDSEQRKTSSFNDEDIATVRTERDEALEKINKLKKIINDMKRNDGRKNIGEASDRVSEGLKQEISVTLNGTNVRINIEIEDTKHYSSDYPTMADTETKEESSKDLDDLLMVTNDEEDEFGLIDVDDSLLDDPEDTFKF